MSDFHQHGLICTLQRLAETNGVELDAKLAVLARQKPVTLILPCHYTELSRPALAHILAEVSQTGFLREVIVSMNGMDAAGFHKARNYFKRLKQPHRILWNDGPRLKAVYQLLTQAKLGNFVSGKGFNTWAATGLVFLEGKSKLVVTQDCDVSSFRREMLARLCFAAMEPELDYGYAKMYYSRVTDRIYGRVSRLFLAPLLHALVRVAGHQPLLDFLLSFRYPLSGEYAIQSELAGAIPMRADWGLEIGLLCDVFRRMEPNRVCQVDGGSNYDHKHQPLGSDADSGLYKMSKEIAHALFEHLADEGLPMTATLQAAVQSSYHRESREALHRYKNLALINGLSFEIAAEQHAVELFSKALGEAMEAPCTAQVTLVCWKDIQGAVQPDFVMRFLSAIAEDEADAG
ncbi:MAG: hypothetical protein WCD79_17185 [Chthoniobacteraceae bacterium]